MNANILASLPHSTTISMFDLVLAILTAFLMGLLIAFVYRFTHRGLNYERSFLVTLVLTGPIVGLVIMLIGSNIALSLGLVGALSIIRFRNVIKDSRDMAFLFWVIAVGLGAGTFNFKVIVMASLLIGAMIFLLYSLNYGKTRHHDCVLVIRGEQQQPTQQIEQIVADFAADSNVRSIESEEGRWELVIEMRLQDSSLSEQESVLGRLRKLEHVQHASIVMPLVNLPL